MEEYLLKIIKGEETGIKARIIFRILNLLSCFYLVIIKLRALVYKLRLKKQHQLPATVISIGNVTVGGTGKTPLVKFLAQELSERGYKTAVLSRGYKSDLESEFGLVSDGKEILMDAKTAGDEGYLLANLLQDVPIVIGKERKITGDYVCREFNPDFVILDDGFQHWQLKRDYDIVVVDSTNPFSNGNLLPAGLLREPLSSLKRASFFVLTKADQINENKLETIKANLKSYNSKAQLITTKHQPGYLRQICSNELETIDLEGENVMAVSGIGNPDSFTKTLESLGAKVVKHFEFPDHYSYEKEDILEIFATASNGEIDSIVTTEKDAVNIEAVDICDLKNNKIDLKVLGIEIELIENSAKLNNLIDRMEAEK